MLLVDATYVHDGGTKVLFYYLIEELAKNNIDVFYLIDDRVNIAEIPVAIQYKKISGVKYYTRHQFFATHKNSFSRILCFNNISPTVKLNAKVFTYLQSSLYFPMLVPFSFKERLHFFIRRKLFALTKKYTDQWITQTNWAKSKLANIYRIKEEEISVIPVFKNDTNEHGNIKKGKNTFLYASNALTHKNHMLLINAFCKFYDEHKIGKLILTVNSIYKNVYDLIAQKIKSGYPIENIGFATRDVINKYYAQSEYYIHPSLTESFGLGLVESIKFGCKVLGADLPYTYEVCIPSAVFDPYNEKSIQDIFQLATTQLLSESTIRVDDKIDQLIELLSN